MRFTPRSRTAAWLLGLVMLTGCGGGSSGPVSLPASQNIVTPVSVAVSISGTAATGAAMAGARVAARCAGETVQDVVAAADGTYTLRVTRSALPCLLKATQADGELSLHSVATLEAGSTTASLQANITPLTELVVAQALGSADTASAFTRLDTGDQARLAAASVNAASLTVRDALSGLLPGLAQVDFVRTPFVAASSQGAGDATDALLDGFATLLAQAVPSTPNLGEQLQTLSARLSTAGAQGATQAASQLLSEPVKGCKPLRNVTYRFLDLWGDSALIQKPDWGSGQVSLGWETRGSETLGVLPDPQEPCRFTLSRASDGTVLDMAVAESGLVVVREQPSGGRKGGLWLGFPEQKLPLARLAGRWNVLGFGGDPQGGWRNTQSVVELNGAGHMIEALDCPGTRWADDACVKAEKSLAMFRLQVDKDKGGYTVYVDGQAGTPSVLPLKGFAYRAPSGAMIWITCMGDPVNFPSLGTGLAIAARVEALQLPVAGSELRFWDAFSAESTPGAQLSTNFSSAQLVIGAVDSTKASFNRLRTQVANRPDGRSDSVYINQPRTGLRLRPAGSYLLDGKLQTFGDLIQMPLPALGLTVSTGTGVDDSINSFLNLSVLRP